MKARFHLVWLNGIPPSTTQSERAKFFSKRFPHALVSEFTLLEKSNEGKSQPNFLRQRAWDTMEALLSERRDSSDKLPIVLLGHQLGGILVKQMIAIATEYPRFDTVTVRIIGIVYLGFPSRRSNGAALWPGQVIHHLCKDDPKQMETSLDLLRTLLQFLDMVEMDGTLICQNARIISVVERQQASSPSQPAVRSLRASKRPGQTIVEIDSGLDEIWHHKDGDEALNGLWKRIREIGGMQLHGEPDSSRGESKRVGWAVSDQRAIAEFLDKIGMCLETWSQIDPEAHHIPFSHLALVRAAPSMAASHGFGDWTRASHNNFHRIRAPAGFGHVVAAYHMSNAVESIQGGSILTSYAFDHRHTPASRARMFWLCMCRQMLLQQPQLYGRAPGMCDALARLTPFSESNLKVVFRSLLHALGTAPVCCMVYSPQAHRACAEELVAQLQDASEGHSVSLSIILTLEDDLPNNGTVYSRNITPPLGNENWFRSLRKDIEKLTTCRLLQERNQWSVNEQSLLQALSTVPTPYLLGLARMGWKGLPEPPQTSTMAELTKILPRSLEDWHEAALRKIQAPDCHWIQAALGWVVYAVRPLTPTELAVAVALEQSGGKESFVTLPDRIACDLIGDVGKAIGPMIQTTDNHQGFVDDTIRLMVAQRLCPKWDHHTLLTSCLDYLDLVLPQLNRKASRKLQAPEFGLFHYATLFWPLHCQASVSKQSTIRTVRFLSHKKVCRSWWRWYTKLEGKKGRPIAETGEEQMALQIACRFGLTGVTEHYTSSIKRHSGTIVDGAEQAQSILDDALEIAARNGCAGSMRDLLRHGAAASSHALTLSARAGSVDGVAELIRVGVDVDSTDENNYSALDHSVLGGFAEITTVLLENGATVDRTGPNGASALHLAAMTGQVAMVELLLQAKGSISQTDAAGYDVLKAAARAGSIAIVRLLLNADADPDTLASDGNNALHVALEAGDPAIIHMILAKTQDVASRNAAGYTALELAARRGNLSVLEELAQRVPSPNTEVIAGSPGEDSTGDTYWFPEESALPLLAIAAQNGHTHIVKWFLQVPGRAGREEGSWAIYQAAEAGHIPTLVELLQQAESETWPIARDAMGRSPLHVAVEKGHLEAVQELISTGEFEVHVVDSRGWTTLHHAAASGNSEIMKILAPSCNDVPLVDGTGKTPLHIAAQKGHLTVLQLLLPVTPDVHLEDQSGKSPLALAIDEGHTAIVSCFLETVNITSDQQYSLSPLHVASQRGHDDLLRMLLDAGWGVHSRNGEGQTPLHYAAGTTHLNAARMLLSAGADVNSPGKSGRTPLFEAVQSKTPELIRELLDAGADINAQDEDQATPLYWAAYYRNLEAVRLLLSRSPLPVLNIMSNGWTELHAAYDSPEVVQALLDAGSDPFVRSKEWGTPLTVAARFGYLESCEVLISTMVSQALQNESLHRLAMHEISAVGRAPALKQLLHAGIDCDISDEDGTTALHIACQKRAREVVELLVRQGASLNKMSSRWGTPLSAAAAGGDAQTVELLLEEGADINIPGTDNRTPLMVALFSGHGRLARGLLTRGAIPGRTHAEYGSALRIAVEREDLDGMQGLLDYGADHTIDVPDLPNLLHAAARQNNREIMRLLLAKETSSLTARDSGGRSLLITAITYRADQVVGLLLEHDELDLDTQDADGKTPLIAAAAIGSEVVPKLLSCKASPHIQDHEGKTALVHAILREHSPSIEALLQDRDSLTKSDARGRSALYWACLTANKDVFQMVLKGVEDFGLVSSLNAHDVAAAVAVKREDFVQDLLSTCNIDLNTPSPDGWSPLSTAKQLKLAAIESQLRAAGAGNRFIGPFDLHIPTRFHPKDKHMCLEISGDGKEITVGAALGDLGTQPRGAVRSDYPMDGLNTFYFEVTITKGSAENIIGVGFCDEKAPLDRMVGWDGGSWGYHGDDGCIFESQGFGKPYGEPYSTGDTIGCCINPTQGTAFYTKNGVPIGPAFQGIQGKLYPAVSFDTSSPGCSVSVNFGNDWNNMFMFEGPYELSDTTSPSPLFQTSATSDLIIATSRRRRRRLMRGMFETIT